MLSYKVNNDEKQYGAVGIELEVITTSIDFPAALLIIILVSTLFSAEPPDLGDDRRIDVACRMPRVITSAS